MNPIIVINPNSSQSVTDGMDRAVQPLRLSGAPDIRCATLAQGPPAIESQQHADSVIEPLCRFARSHTASVFIIGCYSDPGLQQMRESTPTPVLGIAQCAMLTALTRGRKFGVISVLEHVIARHRRYTDSMGLSQCLAGDRALGLGVLELADSERALNRLIEVGIMLRDEDNADVLITGCAGMAPYRQALETAVNLPVVDPVQAAVSMAIGTVCLS